MPLPSKYPRRSNFSGARLRRYLLSALWRPSLAILRMRQRLSCNRIKSSTCSLHSKRYRWMMMSRKCSTTLRHPSRASSRVSQARTRSSKTSLSNRLKSNVSRRKLKSQRSARRSEMNSYRRRVECKRLNRLKCAPLSRS